MQHQKQTIAPQISTPKEEDGIDPELFDIAKGALAKAQESRGRVSPESIRAQIKAMQDAELDEDEAQAQKAQHARITGRLRGTKKWLIPCPICGVPGCYLETSGVEDV